MNAFQTTSLTITADTLSAVERRAFHFLIALLFALIAVYVYFTGTMILHAVAGQEATRTSQEVASSIASLEKEYFSLVSSLTIERATEMGLTSVSEKHFVTRTVRLGTVHGTRDEI